MKNFLNVVSVVACVFAFSGCAVSKNTVTEYDKDGKIIKTTVTEDNVIKSVTESTKDKTVVAWDSSWLAYISASTATTQDPTPTVKMGIGKADKGVLTLHKNHGIEQASAIITAARAGEISITPQGAASKSATKEKIKTDSKTVVDSEK